VSLLRGAGDAGAVDQLRRISRDAAGTDIDWVTSDEPPGSDGHIGAVTDVAVHSSTVVSCGEDGTVKLWDLASRHLLRTCRGHTGWVFATAMSPDGRIIASAGDDGMIRLWHTHTGEPAGVLVGHRRRVRALAFATDGLLVSGGEDGQVRVWDTDHRLLLRTAQTPGTPVWTVTVSDDASVIAAAGEDEFVRLYNLATGHMIAEQAAHRDWIRTVAFAAAAPVLAAGSGDGSATIWSTANHQLTLVRNVPQQETRVRAVALSHDGGLLVAAGEDATLRAFTADDGEPVGVRPALSHVDWIRALALTDRGAVVAGCEDGSIRIWEDQADHHLAVLSHGLNTVWSTQFARNGRYALLGRGDGLVDVRHAASAQVVRTLSAGQGRVWSLASGGPYIAAACGDGTVRMWSLDNDSWSLDLNTGEHRTWAVAINRPGTRAATSTRGAIQVWELPSGQMLWQRPAHTGRIRSIAFDDSGDLLVTGGGDGTTQLWQVSSNIQVAKFTNPGGWVRAVAIDSTSQRVAVGYGPGDIHIHDLAHDKPVAELFGHSGRPLMLAFTNDPDQLVSAAADGTVRSWALAPPRQDAEVRVGASLQCAAFDTDTRAVLTGSAAGVVKINTVNNAQTG
jgi:WD40 repeat protein